MVAEIAEKFKVGRKARVGEHFPAIAADGEHPALFNRVMAVEIKYAFGACNRAEVTHRLAIIFAFGFKPLKFE